MPVPCAVATAVLGVVAVRVPTPAADASPVLVTVAMAEAELGPVLEADPALAVVLPCRLVAPATWALI